MVNIAIDGPAGAGKSTIAREVAKQMGYVYVDTGALYRAVGLYILKNKIDPGDESAIAFKLKEDVNIDIRFTYGEQRILLNGRDVTGEIRTPEVSMAASDVSAIPAVREFLMDTQREIARKNNCIMDGRDIGTVILPNADIKIFLSASSEERARRRYEELREKGIEADYAQVLEELKMRDYNDSTRKTAPLRPADDAIMVDTTGNELRESIHILSNIIKENLAHERV